MQGAAARDQPKTTVVDHLIRKLNSFQPLHPDRQRSLREAHFLRVCEEAKAKGTPWGSPGGPNHITVHLNVPDRISPNQASIPDQIHAAVAAVDYYLETGEEVDCILLASIGEWLRGSDDEWREMKLLEAYNKHFASHHGTINSGLITRMIELQIKFDPQFDHELAYLKSFVNHVKISIKDVTSIGPQLHRFHINFEFVCGVCGGYILRYDETDESASARCGACEITYGACLLQREGSLRMHWQARD